MGLELWALRGEADEVFRAPSLSFVLPLSSAVIAVDAHVVDRTTWLAVPAGLRCRVRAISPSARVLVLSLGDALIDDVIAAYAQLGMDRSRFLQFFAEAQLLPRTVWVYEICERYLFERDALAQHDNDATRFLETEIVKEAFYLRRDREEGMERASLVQRYSSVVEHALAIIEEHLFEPGLMDRLAQAAGASESTLLRAFKKELGATPAAYWRSRRLDEALAMLRARRGTVAEIATAVGYDNPAAFAQAFLARFGQAPSAFVGKKPLRQAPRAI